MRRLLLVAVLALVLPAAPALAQSDPFTPPQVQVPTPTPPVVTPDPDDEQTPQRADPDDGTSRGLLFGVGGIVLVLLAGIAVYITRDARRNLTEADKRAIEREGAGATRMSPQERKERHRTKSRQRQKGKAQRQARKANRPR